MFADGYNKLEDLIIQWNYAFRETSQANGIAIYAFEGEVFIEFC